MKRLERGRKLKARNNGPAYNVYAQGYTEWPHFSSSKRARGAASFVGEWIFRENM